MRQRYYSPRISRVLVCALYHEAKRQRKPMTRLVDELLAAALLDTTTVSTARAQLSSAETACDQSQETGVS
jgi:hypothetical protein